MNDVPGRLRALLGQVADRCWQEPDLEDFMAWRCATLEYWVQMVFAAIAGRRMWSARGETPLITACPAVGARTCRKWADGAVILPGGASALVEVKAVPAGKPAGMRAVAADMAALAAVDWPATLALSGPDAGVDERWWQDRHRIAEPWAVCIALVHGRPPWKSPRPGCQLSWRQGWPACGPVSPGNRRGSCGPGRPWPGPSLRARGPERARRPSCWHGSHRRPDRTIMPLATR